MAGSAFWGTVFLAVFAASSGGDAANFEIILLHTNDMHARFEQTTALSSRCTDADAEANRCYGGMARVASEVRKIRARATSGEGPNVLFLNAGDTYQGTVWYTFHKWRIVARFINLLAFDAISLGNHEFDDGVSGLIPFLNNVTCPVLASNLDLSEEPLLAATPLANSTILVVNGTRIGVIGYLTPDTKELSKSERVKYIDEVDAIKLEADKLKNQGINILIALGHSGFRKDIQIATEVPDIDVVIGGHTNTFLYTGDQPDLEVPESLYPHVVTQPSGRKVYVVQAYAYTKYLGQLDLEFDEHGEVISHKGNPILLDSSVTQDQDILNELEYWRTDIETLQNTVVGRTKVLLDGDRKSCRLVECNMGNLITDAMIDENVLDYTGSGWTDAPIAIQHGGGIRNSIENTANSGTVTRADILEVLPFENAVQKVDLKGDAVLEMLEHSVKNYDLSEAVGGFLQFSGMYVTYDVTKESGKRVVSAMARCGDCRVPTYSPVQSNQTYSILMPSFLVDGGDGFTVFKEKSIKVITLATSDVDIVANYFNRKSPVYSALQGRIKFGTEAKDPGSSASASSSCLVLLFLCWATATVYS